MNTTKTSQAQFDADAKEKQLRMESEQWDTTTPEDARNDDIPTINLDSYFSSGSDSDLDEVARHFANNNTGTHSRYSIPFFFNANPNYVMHCVPTCYSDDNPAKYPPISYAQSQGVAQGE